MSDQRNKAVTLEQAVENIRWDEGAWFLPSSRMRIRDKC